MYRFSKFLQHFLGLLGSKKVTKRHIFLAVFHKSEILKNAVSERWCSDSNFCLQMKLNFPANNFQKCMNRALFPTSMGSTMGINCLAPGHYIVLATESCTLPLGATLIPKEECEQ